MTTDTMSPPTSVYQWLPIETCPRDGRTMFVAVALNQVIPGTNRLYTTDPYCVWWDDYPTPKDEYSNHSTHFRRWPHPYEPTHWCPLPPRTNFEGE